ncbi:spore coat protein CotJB [Jeotgalibacillus malaysiensis]|uniref:spore coat protein CotJB n=1 Tax=Jeotgalibacillus malaysiensis TaxID=1508404 RepID=UPI00384BA3E4
MEKQLPKEYYAKLEAIQAIDFVIYELVLYLNTHPDDAQAIQQYNYYSAYSCRLKTEFEACYGPLRFGMPTQEHQHWEWAESPWPWQV